MIYRMPLAEVIVDFHDALKSITSGFSSFEYQEAGYEKTKLSKIDIKINDEVVDALSFITLTERAQDMGRAVVDRLTEKIDRQQYQVIIQACQGGKVVARGTIQPFRKNVLVKAGKVVGGGDPSRKAKLLAKQKEGKKRMKSIGNIEVSPEAFLSVVSREQK